MRGFVALLWLVMLSSGCSALPLSEALLDDGSESRLPSAAGRDPEGPIPAPKLPPELTSAVQAAPPGDRPARLPYAAACSSPDDPALCRTFEQTSRLYRLADQPPEGETGLAQRLRVSLAEGRDILQALGYYEGTVTGEAARRPDGSARVMVVFVAGPRYRLGSTTVRRTPGSPPPPDEVADRLPATLARAGLPEGAPAEAERVLAAVAAVGEAYRNHGYPFSAIAASTYTLDKTAGLLEADIVVEPGDFTRLGRPRPLGQVSVTGHYLESQTTWREGDPWDQRRVDAYLERLRQTGLFKSIELQPGDRTGADGRRDLALTLTPAPERTVGGSVSYDSDFGFGLRASWEHRNLTGRGDHLRVEAPLWRDWQEVSAKYTLPFLLRRDQDFLAGGAFIRQNTDAYLLKAGLFSAGFERRFSRRLSGRLMAGLEGGSIQDPDEPSRRYFMWGLPAELIYNTTNSLLDASRGLRVTWTFSPYTGYYDEPFSIFRSRLEAQAFWPVRPQRRFVLAWRGIWGTALGAGGASAIPPTTRFYSGGGGSVRGYDYQSLGPRNEDNEPLGGVSLLETSLEGRWKIYGDWGAAAFLDGGTVYAEPADHLGRNLYWGAGLGLRRYTAVGPVRFDVAVPLTRRDGDAGFQIYLSLGQSF